MDVKKKIVLLGNSAVGKTSLIRRFVFDTFEDSYITTIGSKVTKKEIDIDDNGEDKRLTLMIWDVLGTEGYTATHSRTFAGAHGAILVSDLSRKETIDNLESYWIPLLFEIVDNIPIVFVSNKSDLVDRATLKQGLIDNIASRFNVGLEHSLPSHLSASFITSAKSGEGVENAFESLGYLLLSEKMPRDVIKEHCEKLLAEGIFREKGMGSLVDATDTLIVDFCENYGDDAMAMKILRKQFIKAGLDVRNPKKNALLKAVEYLAEVESMHKEEDIVRSNKDRRLRHVSEAH
jgi:small GTP-binding protein